MSSVEFNAAAPPERLKVTEGFLGFETLRLADGAAPAAFRPDSLSFEDVEWPEWTDREESGLRPMT